MIDLMTGVSFLWLSGYAMYSMSRLASGDDRSIHFVLLVFYLFCGVPLAVDLAVGVPNYLYQPNYARAAADIPTCTVYCTWMSMIPPICLYYYPYDRKYKSSFSLRDITPTQKMLCYILLWGPLLSLSFAPNPRMYLSYVAVLSEFPTDQEARYTGVKAILCMISVLTLVLMLSSLRTLNMADVVTMGCSAMQTAWLHGKRSIIAMILMGVLYGLWRRGALRGVRMWGGAVIVASAMVLTTYVYQSNVRGFSTSETSFYFDSVRVDFCRDGVIKQAIFAEIYQNPPILEYRGQSLLYDITFFVPRSVWPGKPWPYAVYATAAMLELNHYDYLGWGITTSILEELLANLGWPGTICGPIFLSLLCRIGDGCKSSLLRALTVSVGCFFVVLHLAAFMTIFVLWMLLVAYFRRKLAITTVAHSNVGARRREGLRPIGRFAG